MPTVDDILAGSLLAGLRRVSRSGGDRQGTTVRFAGRLADLDPAPPPPPVVLSRSPPPAGTAHPLRQALRWASIHQVAAVAAFSAEKWRPTVTVTDIAGRSDIALISIPGDIELTALIRAIMREIGGDAELILGRAEQGLDAVLGAGQAGGDLSALCASVARALGTPVEFRPLTSSTEAASPNGESGYPSGASRSPGREAGRRDADEVSVPVVVGDTSIGCLVAPQAHGDSG